MKAPKFWYKSLTLISLTLLPVTLLYYLLTKINQMIKSPYKSKVPVICIGNLTVGGTGKTPTTIVLVERLVSMGYKPHIISRGYKGTELGPLRVDTKIHTVTQVGDEPLILATFAPTWVSKNKSNGIKVAVKEGADVIVLDDGLQNPSIYKDFSIITVDAKIGFGNGFLLPAGPLREPINSRLKNTNFLLSIGSVKDQNKFISQYKHRLNKAKHIQAEIVPIETGMNWKGLRVLAFAGIGNPEKFFTSLHNLGATIVATKSLDDHQVFNKKILSRLEIEATQLNAQLVTTEKDAIRLPQEFRTNILSLPVRLKMKDWAQLESAINILLKG